MAFGHMLGDTVRETGISEEGLVYDRNVNTTLALAYTLAGGDRDFSFWIAFLYKYGSFYYYGQKGAIRSMPDKEEIEALVSNDNQVQEGTQYRSFDVLLQSVDKVKDFVNDMGRIEGNVYLSSKPLKLEIEAWKDEYAVILEKYLNR